MSRNSTTAAGLCLLVAAGCGQRPQDSVPGATATPELRADPTVLVVVMDGARTQETLGERPSSATGDMPWEMLPSVWEQLVPKGVRATNAWVLSSSTTVPGHMAMITGRREPATANYPPGDGPGAYLSTLPTIGQALLAERPELPSRAAATIANTRLLELLADGLHPGMPRADEHSWTFVDNIQGNGHGSSDDGEVLNSLRDAMDGGDLRLAVLNLHQVDRSGHNGDEDAYPEQLRDLDRPIADLWRWVQQQDAYRDRTYLLLLSDHGRHSDGGSDPPWRHHGCSCTGCRHLPFLMLGPGVRAGDDLRTPLLLVDVAPTVAALLEVDMPWADGLVRDDLLLAPSGASSRRGMADLAVSGTHRAELRYRQDPGQRSALWVDGQRLSDPDAVVVEAPALASTGEQAWACWRQIDAAVKDERVSWNAACATSQDDGASWQAIDFAVQRVGPYGRVILAPDDDGLVAAWINSPSGATSGGGEGPDDKGSTVSLRIARQGEEGWTSSSAPSVPSFPTDLTMVRDGDSYHLVLAASQPDVGKEARHTRRIYLAQASPDGDGFALSEPSVVDLSSQAPDDPSWRLEFPAVTIDDDGRLLLAATGMGSTGSSQAVLASSEDDGESFATQLTLDLPGAPLPNVRPVWLGERAVFPVLDTETEEASLCAGTMDGEVVCVATGSQRIQRMVVDGDTLHVILDTGQGDWERHQWKAWSFDGQ